MARMLWVVCVLLGAGPALAEGQGAVKVVFKTEKGGQGLRQAWRAAAQASERFTMLRLLDPARCKRPGQKAPCVEVCASGRKDCGRKPMGRKALTEGALDAGYVCDKTRCAVAVATAAGLTLIDAPGVGDIRKPIKRPLATAQVLAIIPPFVWEWFTGSPFCCEDCWAVHRNAGLPCAADMACCAGTCGEQPGCGGGTGGSGGGGPGAGGGGGGADGDSCGAAHEVHGVTVTMWDGSTCNFDGTAYPTWVGGECVEVAGEGVYYGCSGEVVIEIEDEKEVEAPTP